MNSAPPPDADLSRTLPFPVTCDWAPRQQGKAPSFLAVLINRCPPLGETPTRRGSTRTASQRLAFQDAPGAGTFLRSSSCRSLRATNQSPLSARAGARSGRASRPACQLVCSFVALLAIAVLPSQLGRDGNRSRRRMWRPQSGIAQSRPVVSTALRARFIVLVPINDRRTVPLTCRTSMPRSTAASVVVFVFVFVLVGRKASCRCHLQRRQGVTCNFEQRLRCSVPENSCACSRHGRVPSPRQGAKGVIHGRVQHQVRPG
jgi:hypothetical protein